MNCWQDLLRDDLHMCVVRGEGGLEERSKSRILQMPFHWKNRRHGICGRWENYALAMSEKVITCINSDLMTHGALFSTWWWTCKANSTITLLSTQVSSLSFSSKNGATQGIMTASWVTCLVLSYLFNN